MGLLELTGTAIRGMRRRGFWGVACELRKRVRWAVTRTIYARQDHVWCWCQLGAGRLDGALPDGFTVHRVGFDEVDLVLQLGVADIEEARRRLDEAASYWVACAADEPVSGIWVFEDEFPVFAARSGSLSLPRRAVALENALTAPAYRRLGLGMAILTDLARYHAERGCTDVLVKTEKDNVPVRTGLRKAGFSEIASMHLLKIGPWRRVSIRPTGEGSAAMAQYLSTAFTT